MLAHRISLLLAIFICGCVSGQQVSHKSLVDSKAQDHQTEEAYTEKEELLRSDLAALNGRMNMLEAAKVAQTAIQYSSYLAAEYEVVRPAVLHNVLIRLGLKERGLCYHWTEDLLRRLQTLDLNTYQLHWGVAHRGSDLREHNSVVITGKGQAFADGMVLDPWRNSGDLYWALVKTDRYPWKELPASQW